MDIQTSLAVAGIIATVLLGIWAIAITVRYNRSVQITHALDMAIALTDDISQNFPELRVIFRNEPVAENLVLLKGYFINTGNKDISREMTEQQITLKLPGEFEWIECKVVDYSPALQATARLSGKTEACFETGLWKTKEYFKFEALAKVPVIKADPDNLPEQGPTRRLLKAVTFSHRIADSTVIRETEMPEPVRPKGKGLSVAALFFGPGTPRFNLGLSAILALAVVALIVVVYLNPEKSVGYRMEIDGQERFLFPRVKQDLVLLSDSKGFKRQYALAELESLLGKRLVIVSRWDRNVLWIAPIGLCVAAVLFVVSGMEILREKRLLSMVSQKGKANYPPAKPRADSSSVNAPAQGGGS